MTAVKKGSGLVLALQTAFDGAIARNEYQRVLIRQEEQSEAVAQSVASPSGITH